jgi:hypothetical protein
MARAAIIADVHVANHNAFGGTPVGRVNERCRAVLDALARGVEVAQDADVLVVAGDLFDGDNPFPDQVRLTGEVLAKHPRTVLAVGNHDQHSAAAADHALAPLELIPTVQVAEQPKRVQAGALIIDVLPYHVDVLNYTPTVGCKVVVGHHGIADEKTAPFLRHGKGVVQTKDLFAWMNLHGVNIYVAGDWHVHAHWEKGGKHIVQVGALCPTGWNNPGHYGYGSVIVTDGETWERRTVNGPRFLFAGGADEVLKEVRKATKRGDIPYVRASCPAFEDEALEGSHIEWAPVVAMAEGNVRVAAEHLKSSDTLDECLAAYIDNDAGIPDAMRAAVRDRVQAYLRNQA